MKKIGIKFETVEGEKHDYEKLVFMDYIGETGYMKIMVADEYDRIFSLFVKATNIKKLEVGIHPK